MAVVDVFRVEGCRIVEHWDVVQLVPEESANKNTVFQPPECGANDRRSEL